MITYEIQYVEMVDDSKGMFVMFHPQYWVVCIFYIGFVVCGQTNTHQQPLRFEMRKCADIGSYTKYKIYSKQTV